MLWDPSFETGVAEIDRQNFDLIARIEAMRYPDNNKARFDQLVTFEHLVADYFERDQTLHDKCCYSGAEKHKFIHRSYLHHLQKIKHNFIESGPTLENEMIFIKDAVESLKKHIVSYDKRFAAFYHKSIIGAKLMQAGG